MKEIILQKLTELEHSENIKILYVCESGSRAWGFASPDSDFDVRFIYTRDVNHYLSIAEMPDVVGLPVNEVLDIGGWDLKKALKLFLKSNGPLYEWLQSPIVYRQDNAFADKMRSLMPAWIIPTLLTPYRQFGIFYRQLVIRIKGGQVNFGNRGQLIVVYPI